MPRLVSQTLSVNDDVMPAIATEILPILALTLWVSGAAVVISSTIGIPVGVLLGLSEFRGKALVKTLVFTGMAMPPVVAGLLLYILLSRSGPLGNWEWLFTPRAMILAQVLLDLPFVVGITMTAAAVLPRELVFQVRSLGATPWQARWTLLTEMRSGVLLALATALGRSISEVGAVWLVGGNIEGHTRVMTTAIMLETSRGRFVVALALGTILLSLALMANLAIMRLQGRPAP